MLSLNYLSTCSLRLKVHQAPLCSTGIQHVHCYPVYHIAILFALYIHLKWIKTLQHSLKFIGLSVVLSELELLQLVALPQWFLIPCSKLPSAF